MEIKKKENTINYKLFTSNSIGKSDLCRKYL